MNALLRAGSAVAICMLIVLAGCTPPAASPGATAEISANLQQAGQDAEIIVAGLAGVAPEIEAAAGVGSAQAGQVGAALAAAQAAADALQHASADAAPAQVRAFAAGVNAALAAADALHLGGSAAQAIAAAKVLLPAVETIVAGGAAAPIPGSSMTTDQARLVLLAAAKRS